MRLNSSDKYQPGNETKHSSDNYQLGNETMRHKSSLEQDGVGWVEACEVRSKSSLPTQVIVCCQTTNGSNGYKVRVARHCGAYKEEVLIGLTPYH